ncbi:hypothetical protein Q8G42_00185 [Acinetobacter lwoffii]|uniref:Scaffolding protein n=1 Tax=Acinetobacter lwoffii TaxID=28090 RepID=A0AAW8AY71_ACILW|nr:hypothetical protein [Acinetobacter lwoffii]MDP1369208.1 hypothetical protein [Acinetobacter lwoffii]MDP1388662.1 hypothetical protein [Acinetobacter lwoffii]MDP1446348.1 hypothetical protein [Acinetobacter lwoffii]
MNEQQNPNPENVPAVEPVPTPEPTPGAEPQPTPGTPPADPAPGEPNPAPVETDPAKAVPESADAYSVSIDGFDFDAFKADNTEVLESFHAEGMTNKQVEAVVKAYEQHQSVQMEALQEEWGNDFGANVNLAKQAIEALGFQASDLDSPIGALKLAAAIGKHIQEDLPPSNTQQNVGESVQQLMMSEAYLNDKHPDHKRVYAQVEQAYAKQYQ